MSRNSFYFLWTLCTALFLQCCNNSSRPKTLDDVFQELQTEKVSSSNSINTSKDVEVVSIDLNEEKAFKIIGFSNVPAKNCEGDNLLRITETLSKTVTQGFNISASSSLDAGISKLVKVAIGLQLETSKTTDIERSFALEIEVKPNSNTLYKIIWKEVWRNGVAKVQKSDGAIIKVPFQVKNGIEYELHSVESSSCE